MTNVHRSPSHMTICNQAYFFPRTILISQYYIILTIIVVILLWHQIVLLCDRNVTLVIPWYVTSHTCSTIWHHNSSTMPPTVEQQMIVKYSVESSNIIVIDQWAWTINIWYNKANIDLWCWAIWALWTFCNSFDLGFASVNIVATEL